MTDSERDPLVHRAIGELRRLPATNEAAIKRVVAAAAAARLTPADDDGEMTISRQSSPLRVWTVVGIAAAAAFVGFTLRGVYSPNPPAEQLAVDAASSPTTTALRPVAGVDREALPIPQQFVFNNNRARRISVVGDFNRWNPAATPMTRSPDGELWSVTIPIAPGRHMYGFMVDDTLLVLDPRAPKQRDPDLGTEGSVIIVGRP